ncbi:hypothetical protein LC653_05830 [Nostoc sp. CHAB 5784]|uniref:hypothetical protein n=1 Tax=Nostoc mirabile TaxID=2907820 RepID=UPI001E52522C|nr:hypothetical protein [Nostoc mirabile]MCC5663465.1 hypothetical protein [Nostoc mirabile CHAB5784]
MISRFITDKNFENHKALQQRLMSLPEEAQFDEISAILDRNSVIGLKLANAILKNKRYFEILLERGVAEANASEIELWLKYLLPRLGFRRVIAILSGKLSEQPQEVRKASYWLPKFLPKGNEQAAKLLKELLNKEKQMLGKEYKAVRTSGQIYKLILRIKSTGEYAVFGGYQLGSQGSKIIVEVLNSEDLYPTGGLREVSPSDVEILDPQPYND